MRKGVIFVQIPNAGFKTHNFETVIATDLKCATNILTLFSYTDLDF